MIMECIELNWLCKHMKEVRSSQASIFVINWVKHSFSPWVLFKHGKYFFDVILDLEILIYLKSKKYLIFNSQQQQVQRFYLFTWAIHYVIVSSDLLVLY